MAGSFHSMHHRYNTLQSQLFNIQFTPGPTGMTGQKGEDSSVAGPTGMTGQNGADSSVAGPTGPTGQNGADSNVAGPTGEAGSQGNIGATGPRGSDGISSNLYNYKADANHGSGTPAPGYLLWNTNLQISATTIRFSFLTSLGNDVDLFLSVLKSGDSLVIQSQSNSNVFQRWVVNGMPTIVPNSYVIVPVAYSSGAAEFAHNDEIIAVIQTIGLTGPAGPAGIQGPIGLTGPSIWVPTATSDLNMNSFNIKSASPLTIGQMERNTNLVGIVKIPNDLIVGDPTLNESIRIYGGMGGASFNNVGTQNDIQLNIGTRNRNALFVAGIIKTSTASILTLPDCALHNGYTVKVVNTSNSTWTIRGQINEPILQGPAGPGLLNPNGVSIGPYQSMGFLQVDNSSGKYSLMDIEVITCFLR